MSNPRPLRRALTFSALLPWCGALCALKPDLGLAVLSYRPTRATFITYVAFGLLFLAIAPDWLFDRLGGLRQQAGAGRPHEILMPQTAGFMLVLPARAVRRASGRAA